MPSYSVQVELNSANVTPADKVINTWAFQAVNLASLDDALTSLLAFYNGIDQYLSNTLSNVAGAHRFKAYDLADPEPRVPVVNDAITIVRGATSAPRECALALSFQAAPVSGLPPARRKGRVFLGPFDSTNSLEAASGRPNAALIGDLVTQAENLLNASLADPDWSWCVWSRTDNVLREVIGGWVDDEWDTVRSRGRLALTRSEFP